jgi:hypothetical protein
VVTEKLPGDIEGATAAVKAREKHLGKTFLDTLSLIKVKSGWKLYNKLFHVENE